MEFDSLVGSPQNEFWFHVAAQEEIPIAGEIEIGFDFVGISQFLSAPPEAEAEFHTYLKDHLKNNIDLIDDLRTLLGVSNKRLYLELSLVLGRSEVEGNGRKGLTGDHFYNLSKHDTKFFKKLFRTSGPDQEKVQSTIVDYLVSKGLFQISKEMKGVGEEALKIIITALVFPKEKQQKEAKRRGHGAEQKLAAFVHELRIGFLPSDRHTNPMASQDPNVFESDFTVSDKKIKNSTLSFDLVLFDKDHNPGIFVQSLIHTSDPGQYGVNKSDETALISEKLRALNVDRPEIKRELWGLVDGFGFSENKKDTIDKMLSHFDCFIQMKTIYKAALRMHQRGQVIVKAIRFDSEFYNAQEIADLTRKYVANDITVLCEADTDPAGMRRLEGGSATVYL